MDDLVYEMVDGVLVAKRHVPADAAPPPPPPAEPVTLEACKQCPIYISKIKELNMIISRHETTISNHETTISRHETTIIELERIIAELRSRLHYISELETTIEELRREITDLRREITRLESEVERLKALIRELQNTVQELESTLRDRDARILMLEREMEEMSTRMKMLMEENESLFQEKTKLARDLEEHQIMCHEKHIEKRTPQPLVKNGKWTYRVQNQEHAEFFSQEPYYAGEPVQVGAVHLEGATLLNPNFSREAEEAPGSSRLRVRVIDVIDIPLNEAEATLNSCGSCQRGWYSANEPNHPVSGCQEVYVQLFVNTSFRPTFTNPRPASSSIIKFHQEFVFVGCPLQPHPTFPNTTVASAPLVVRVMLRTPGTTNEVCVGSANVNLSDLYVGTTRVLSVQLSQQGSISLRIKAIDFGLRAY
eukprot:NODE_675_length_1432_cov_115.798265_g505_i0.p1 GENE.NODE_675_length_1432_cov_115.798265_g505_i0~~NODE_675_length_1432_cov_115.798265_g505_i0.p1  ORF type:complete len:445 (+),score=95.88 NODE_675_length_1432_cov_115.798265_g505_i0:66-1337(+)